MTTPQTTTANDAQTKPVPTGAMATEPAAVIGSITAIAAAIVAALIAFGVDISDAQQDALLGLVAVLAPIVAGLVIRKKVASPSTAQAAANTSAQTGRARDVMKG